MTLSFSTRTRALRKQTASFH